MARNGKHQEQEPYLITAIAVKGFKGFAKEQRIELRNLTILAGANSSGKSSIMQPALLLKQTLESQFDPGALLLNGPIVRVTSADQILSRSPKRNSFSVRFEAEGLGSISSVYRRGAKFGFEVESVTYETADGTVDTVRRGTSERGFLAIEHSPPNSEYGFHVKFPAHAPPYWATERFLRNLIHVSGLRGLPERSYSRTAVAHSFPGDFENYAASVIAAWPANSVHTKTLGEILERLGLAWSIRAKSIDDARVELEVARLPHLGGLTDDFVNIADVGLGVSQVLPVVVALQIGRPGQTVYLEQPEIHLHPRAQRALADLVAESARRGVRVIVETHSSLLITGIQTLIASGKLEPELVKLHWFQRNPKTGATSVRSADLDANGAFGDWPEDFDDVSLDATRQYLDAVESRVFKTQ